MAFFSMGLFFFLFFLPESHNYLHKWLTETKAGANVEEKARMNNSPVFSVMYRFVIEHLFARIVIWNKTRELSERATPLTSNFEMLRPLEII